MRQGKYVCRKGKFYHIDSIQQAQAWGERVGILVMIALFILLAILGG